MSDKDEGLNLKLTARNLLTHTLLAFGVMLVLLALFALAILSGAIPPNARLGPALLAEFVGVLFAALRAAKHTKTRKLPTSCLVGLLTFIVLALGGFFFSFPPAKQSPAVFLCALTAALAGGVLSAKPYRSRRRRQE